MFAQVYHQLENLSRADPPYKSIAALNCIILGSANIWDVDRAYQTFAAIEATFGLTPDIHSYNALLCAFGKLGKVTSVHTWVTLICFDMFYYMLHWQWYSSASSGISLKKLCLDTVFKKYFHQAS